MSKMRAKMSITSIVQPWEGATEQKIEKLNFSCVCGTAPFGPEGESEDNTFARYSPSGDLSITVNNPNLFGTFKVGQTFYLDFTEAAE